MLKVEAPGFSEAEYAGELNSTVPLVHEIHYKSVTQLQQVALVGSDLLIESDASGTQHDLESEQFERMPIAPPNRAMSAVVESVPGIIPEENGRIHARGSEVQPQYILDGVPISENVSATFSTGLDIENLRSTQVITGNIPAEFGDKTSAIVTLNTKSGLDTPWRGSVSASGGSFDSGAIDAEVGGRFRKIGMFLTADTSRNRRFLDPPEIENFHNRGGLTHFFARFDWMASTKDVFRLTLSTNGTDFQVPNMQEQQLEGQKQRQELRDDYEAFAWNHTFDGTAVSDVTVFRRSSTGRLLDPDQTGKPFFLEQNRRQRTEGLRASMSKDWKASSLKVGVEAYRLPVSERFELAVTDPVDVDPDTPILAYTLEQPFVFNEKKTGTRVAWYIQDHVRIGEHLTADLGLRFDSYHLLIDDSAFSPRIGLAYYIKRTGTVFRGSYNRLVQTPPLENLLLSSSTAAAALSSVNSGSFSAVPAERQNAYEIGVQQQFGRYLRLDVVRYAKNIKHSLDDEQLFTTAVVFPVALAAADVRGTEVRLDLRPTQGWTAYASYANARGTITGPLTGGLLFSGEAGALAAGERQAADSDERNEGQFGVTYNHKSGAWINLTGRYDSGLPTEFDPGDFAGFEPNIQKQLDPVRMRIKPRALFDVATGIELRHDSRFPVSLQLGVNNLTNRFYLYNFQSTFSGTHIGRPREVVGRIVFSWAGNK